MHHGAVFGFATILGVGPAAASSPLPDQCNDHRDHHREADGAIDNGDALDKVIGHSSVESAIQLMSSATLNATHQ
jgi:hypothetical protein